jgi:hypothetical protein
LRASRAGHQTAPALARDGVVEEAKEEGIAFAPLKRAKKELGIRSHKERDKIDGDWFWELPRKGSASTRRRARGKGQRPATKV